MNAELQKTCLREIGHIVFDANEKITVRRISNTWNIDSQQSVEVLQKWVEDQKSKKKLSLEYIIRGIDKAGNVFITISNEARMEKLYKLDPKCSKMLYAVEVASDIRPLNVDKDNEFNVVNLRLDSKARKIEERPSTPVQSVPSAPPKQEQKISKPNNMFAKASKPPVKEEKPSPPPTNVAVKAEPKVASPPKASPKQQSPKKDTKKPVSGKGSISSFFSSKPTQSGTVSSIKPEPQSPAPTPPMPTQKETKSAEKSKTATKPEAVAKTRKRTITDDEATEEEEDVIPNTPQEDKKRNESRKRGSKPLLQRKKTANPSKKSRLLQICDSSSEEEQDDTEAIERGKERLIEFDEEMAEPPAEEPRKSLSPEKPIENDSNSANRNRAKVKKLVTKTYTDEEGYLITVKEHEMVSEDESESKEQGKETSSPAATKPKAAPLASQRKSASVEKKETPPTPKTKQGSIMSFFAKK